MKKNNLDTTGLSLSQASSISNLCNQRCVEIGNKISAVNNYSKSVNIGGEKHYLKKGIVMPENIIDLLKEKASLHACQGFLMENIRAKDDLLKNLKTKSADVSGIAIPTKPVYVDFTNEMLDDVDESVFGIEQLTASELNEYYEAEAYAAHLGQFIHEKGGKNQNGGQLDTLRKELQIIPDIEWMEVETGKKTPVNITVHHTAEGLLKIHEDVAKLHREYEQKVNYYKAKMKNAVTIEKSRIAKHNADLQNKAANLNSVATSEYSLKLKEYQDKVKSFQMDFEKIRQSEILKVSTLRIKIDSRFQPIIDLFLQKLGNENIEVDN